MTKPAQKLIWWNVTMAWGQSDEGTYSESFMAPNEESAKRMCAEEMADSGEVELDGGNDRQRFIEARMGGYADVYRTDAQFHQDFEKLFGFSVDLDKLGELIAANRDALQNPSVNSQRPRG